MRTPSFDNWTIIFLLFAFLGLVTAVLILFQNQRNRKGKSLISILLLLFSLMLVDYVLYWTGYQAYFPHLINFSFAFALLYGPLLLMYLNISAGSIAKNDWLHFVPFAVVFVIGLPIHFQSTETILKLMENGVPKRTFYNYFFRIVPWFTTLHLMGYSFAVYRKQAVFAGFPIIRKWTATLATALSGIALSSLLYMVLMRIGILKPEWDYMISFAMVLFIVLITTASFLKPQVFNDKIPFLDTANAAKYKNSPIDKHSGKVLASQLHELVMARQLWRKNDLRLDDLSELMDLPKQYISQIINEQYDRNFFEFVNGYRIDEAQQLIEKVPNLTLIEIAYEVGFNNKVSFGKAFRNTTGKSPLEFKRTLHAKIKTS
jgi:AraC-like DNA-binding protein